MRQRFLSLLIPAYLYLIASPPRDAVADPVTLTAQARNSGGNISAYTPVFTSTVPPPPGAWVYISLTPDEGLVLIDGTRYGQGFIAHGEPGHRLTGTVDMAGFAGLAPFTSLAGCWSFDGTTITIQFGTASPCPLADWNLDGAIGVQDIFDFLVDYFASPRLGEGDLFDFLSAWMEH